MKTYTIMFKDGNELYFKVMDDFKEAVEIAATYGVDNPHLTIDVVCSDTETGRNTIMFTSPAIQTTDEEEWTWPI